MFTLRIIQTKYLRLSDLLLRVSPPTFHQQQPSKRFRVSTISDRVAKYNFFLMPHYSLQPRHPHTKSPPSHSVTSLLSGWSALVRLLPAILALPPYTVVFADAHPAALLALAAYAVVFTDDRPAALIARASYMVVLTGRCSTHRISYTCFFGGCALRCSPPRIASSRF